MGIITLISDYGLRDNTVARLKIRLMRRIEEARLLDISHLVEPHNILEAAHSSEVCTATFQRAPYTVS